MKAKVVGGSGEGAKYVEVYSDKLKKKVGFEPYPGTLNLEVKGVPPLETSCIEEFGKFGAVELAPCAVNRERAFAVFPEKAEEPEEGEPEVVEVIAEKNLKALLGLENGDFVDLQF